MSCTEIKKKVVQAEILVNIQIGEGIYRMELNAPEVTASARAGQFVNVYLNNKSLLLPRPISICEIKNEIITLVYGVVGQGTKELSLYECGQKVRISTANGNGFDLDAMEASFSLKIDSNEERQTKEKIDKKNYGRKTVVLVAGGIGVPPMVELAKAIRKRETEIMNSEADKKINLVAVIGFKQEPFLEKELQVICDQVHVATDNGNAGFHGNVLDLITKKNMEMDYCFSCGPKVMLKSLTKYCISQKTTGGQDGIPIQVSMEERMGCGYGACVGCTCKINEKDPDSKDHIIVLKKVCKDGPVFFGSEVAFDE